MFLGKKAADKVVGVGQSMCNRVESLATKALKHYFLVFELRGGLYLDSHKTEYRYFRAERQAALEPDGAPEGAAAGGEAHHNLRFCR